MAEFLLELFSEEIPANLQSSARINLLISFKKFFEKENINYKDDAKVFSTPNRLVLCFKKIEREIHQKSEEIKGPNTKAPDNAIEGFLKSNLIQKKDNCHNRTRRTSRGSTPRFLFQARNNTEFPPVAETSFLLAF